MNKKVTVYIFLLLFVIFSLSELIFSYLFYDEMSYLRTIGFGVVISLLVTFMLLKQGGINKVGDVLKYKKTKIKINTKITAHQLFLITETLKLNKYIINNKRTTVNKISCTTKFTLLDFGDIYTILFNENEIIIKSRPKSVVIITDTNRITSHRVKQIEAIIMQCTAA